jgi:ATP/maltotriose-dependent transcriptional regulator MalT
MKHRHGLLTAHSGAAHRARAARPLRPRPAVLGAALAEELAAFPEAAPPAPPSTGADSPDGAGPAERLTEREREVLARLAQRWSNKEIAAALRVSPETVKRHAANLYVKLSVAGRTEAVRRAGVLGLFPLARPSGDPERPPRPT